MGNALLRDAKKSKKLQGANRGLNRVPPGAFGIKGLEEVWLQNNDIRGAPFFHEPDESALSSPNSTPALPPGKLSGWGSAELVYLNGNKQLEGLPKETKHWLRLEEANFSDTRIAELPAEAAEAWVTQSTSPKNTNVCILQSQKKSL